MIKSFEDFQAFGKDGFETYVASATAMTKGLQAIAAEAADFSRKSFEKNTEVFQKCGRCQVVRQGRRAAAELRQGSL